MKVSGFIFKFLIVKVINCKFFWCFFVIYWKFIERRSFNFNCSIFNMLWIFWYKWWENWFLINYIRVWFIVDSFVFFVLFILCCWFWLIFYICYVYFFCVIKVVWWFDFGSGFYWCRRVVSIKRRCEMWIWC